MPALANALPAAPRGQPASVDALRRQADAGLGVLDDPLEQARFTQWVDARAPDGTAQRRGVSAIQLAGLHCAACAGIIERALLAVPGVCSATVSAAAQRASVRWDPERTQPSQWLAAVRAAGYGAVPDAAAPARELRRAEHRSALWRLFVASFCAMQVMMFAAPSYFAAPGQMSADIRMLLDWASWLLCLPVLGFAAGPFFAAAWQSLRAQRLSMDLPVALGIAVTFVASTGAAFDPGGPFGNTVYFDSLSMFVAFLLAARYFELRARHRAAETMESTLARMPETALRLDEEGHSEAVSVLRLARGDRVRVPAGAAFPADGTLLEGSTTADEALLSGESTPVAKPPGSAVVAGSANLGAPVVMRVERVGADTRYEAIVALMRGALAERPALARAADRWAGPFLLAVLALAALAAAVWSVVDPARAVWVAVSVLIVTCPCALSLAAPATLVAAAGGLARRGVLLQRLDALEALARATKVYLDKTGTLTEERLELRAASPVGAGDSRAAADGLDAAALRDRAASLARWSQHPLARSLAAAYPEARGEWSDVREIAGAGLAALDPEGVEWRLGSAAWTAAAGGDDEATVWLARAGVVQMHFVFDERLRDGAAEAVAALRAAGLATVLLSGDAPARVERLARRLGIDDYVAGATPQTKLAAIADAQRRGERVAMVGDGVNDAPVLARADVSIAMGEGALVARAHADAVLVASRPLDLVRAHASARKAMRIVRQNLVWAGGYNLLCVPLALAGWLPPWAAGLGMAGSSLVVVANSLRAAR